jgi:hypothetical protein
MNPQVKWIDPYIALLLMVDIFLLSHVLPLGIQTERIIEAVTMLLFYLWLWEWVKKRG